MTRGGGWHPRFSSWPAGEPAIQDCRAPFAVGVFDMAVQRAVGEAGWGRTIGAGIVSLIYFFPVLWIILTAFKTHNDALAVPPKWLFTPTLENFVAVFSRAYTVGAEAVSTGFDLFFFNSVLIAGVSVLIAVVTGTLAAYGFSRFPLKGNDTYLFVILSTRMMPAIVVIIPIFQLFQVTGLAGSYTGIILLYAVFNLPFTVWMMKSFFDELNRDVEDAARLDGSSERRVFFKICLPQVRAGIAATIVFGLILTWNEFLFALLLSGVETRTVPVAMAQTIGGDIGVRWGLLAAIETLFLIPVIVVVFFLQQHLLRGVTFGTIKK
jgi:multiple sugar transport system permease protein